MSAEGFDWEALDARFRAATPLCGVAPEAADWWQAWHAHLAAREEPRWFYTPEDAPAWFVAHWPELTRRCVAVAESLLTDLVYARKFRPVRLPNGDVDWGRNPTKTMSWAGFHYWSWANPLIRAYGLTRDERFPRELATHVRSYFEQMDSFTPELWEGGTPAATDAETRDRITFNDLSAGIKMATFCEAIMVCRRSRAWTPDDLRRATLMCLRLAERIYETYKDADEADYLNTRNFLTSGAAGLGVVAAILPECAWGEAWAPLARRILEVHLMELFYPDGGHRELCTQYHKTGIRDIVFYEQVLAAQGRGHFGSVEPWRSKLLATLKFLAAILMPDGSTAVLNSAAASNDWLVHFIILNKWLRDPELAWHARRWWHAGYVPRQKSIPSLNARLLGTGDAPDPSIPAAEPQATSVLLPDSGVAVLRDTWDENASVMVLDFGRPLGGHAYPARSSFSLYLGGRLVAQSPGSPFTYSDPDYAGWMHTSFSQNMVILDDLNQDQWDEARKERVWCEVLRWEADADGALVQARDAGYLASAGVMHVRTVRLVAGRFFLVHDQLDASAAEQDHLAKWSFQCAAPLREQEGRTCVADGLVRITPAWPETISEIVFGAEGKAVWPEESEEGTGDTYRRLHHARWCAPVAAGGAAEFLMLIQADGEPCQFRAVRREGGSVLADVARGDEGITVSLPGLDSEGPSE